MQTRIFGATSRRLALALLVTLGGTACASDLGRALAGLHQAAFTGQDFNLQIEATQGPAAASYPNQGAIVRHMMASGQWTSQGAGGLNHRDARGVSQWRRGGEATLIETSTDASGTPATSTLTYTFEGLDRGRWSWDINHGQAVLSGSFTLSPSKPTPAQQLAPVTNAGLHIPLIIKSGASDSLPPGVFPTAGLVLQTYAANGTLTLQGFGPGNINSKGTYTFKRLSATTAVEEAVQTSDFFVWPYTMVYTFKTPTSGTWYQSLNDGLIRFSGTFDTFPR